MWGNVGVLCYSGLGLEEAFVAKIFVQMLPVDAVRRERVLFALGGCGIAQCSIVGKALAGLLSVGSLHPNLGWREPVFVTSIIVTSVC